MESGQAFSLTTVNTVNAQGLYESIDPPGSGADDVTAFSYDPARGNQIQLSRTEPLIGATTFGYDELNRRTSVTDPNGTVREFTYDALGRVLSVTHKGATPAGDLVTHYEYNVFGDLHRTTHPRGNVLEYRYDSIGRLLGFDKKPDAGTPGETVEFTLDSAGHPVREERRRWDGSQWVTDFLQIYVYSNRCTFLQKIVHADGSATEFSYDCNGNLEAVWDANHPSNGQSAAATTRYEYDVLNRLISTTQPWAGAGGGIAAKIFAYDVQDNRVSVTDGEGNLATYAYSDRGLLTRETSEITGITSFEYDEQGELVEATDPRGVTITRSVDVLGRSTFVDFPDDALDTTYFYENPLVAFSKGVLTRMERGGSTIDFRYDRFGRMTQDGLLTYDYDGNGNRTEIGYPGGLVANYTHDYADREASLVVEDQSGGAPVTLVSGARYLSSGPLAELSLGNGVTESRQFDQRFYTSRIVASRTSGTLLDWAYTLDKVGNPTHIADTLNPARDRDFSYLDYQYFLSEGDGLWGNFSWAYDKGGNRISETRDGTTEIYSYFKNSGEKNTPKLSAIGHPSVAPSVSFAFDADGNQTLHAGEDAKVRFVYDAASRLRQMIADSSEAPPSRTTLSYDPRGYFRKAEHVPSIGGQWQRVTEATFSSAGSLYLRETTTRLGVTTARNVPTVQEYAAVFYFSGRPVAILERKNFEPADGGAPFSSLDWIYLTTDHLGTPILATDDSGSSVWEGGFDPFGNDFSGAQAAGVFLRFPGQWFDEALRLPQQNETLVFNLHRMYLSSRGRYTAKDLLGNLGGDNLLYGYAHANPLYFTDPLGLVIRAPGLVEGFIPVWGSARQSIHDFQCGRWGWGLFNAAMAGLDLFGGGSLLKGGWKLGSHTWKATRSWLGRRGLAGPGQHVHHAFVPRRAFSGTNGESVFNQWWNLKPLNPSVGIDPDTWHRMVDGRLPGLNRFQRWWHGTPDWAKAAETSFAGKAGNAARDQECGCE